MLFQAQNVPKTTLAAAAAELHLKHHRRSLQHFPIPPKKQTGKYEKNKRKKRLSMGVLVPKALGE